jgi:hypothetical protein
MSKIVIVILVYIIVTNLQIALTCWARGGEVMRFL